MSLGFSHQDIPIRVAFHCGGCDELHVENRTITHAILELDDEGDITDIRFIVRDQSDGIHINDDEQLAESAHVEMPDGSLMPWSEYDAGDIAEEGESKSEEAERILWATMPAWTDELSERVASHIADHHDEMPDVPGSDATPQEMADFVIKVAKEMGLA